MGLRAVVITDVIDSSQLSDESRRELDRSLRRCFHVMNERHDGSLSARFGYSLGDEFQAVFQVPADAIKPVFLMHSWLASQSGVGSIRVRSAVGVGRVSVETSREPRTQDGPAFHVARRLIESIHEDGRTIAVACDGDAPIVRVCNAGLDAGCRLVDSRLKDWTIPQWEAAYWKWSGYRSSQVAEQLSTSRQSISKRLASADFSAIDSAIQGFRSMLDVAELSEAIDAAAGLGPR